MERKESVIRFYGLANSLKDLIRTGWVSWDIERKRVESVAEHVFGVEMLAIAMKSEYKIDVDLQKVILMIAIHELEEILIGDIEVTDVNYQAKTKNGHEAIHAILECLLDGEELEKIILEFDERKTKEALFAYHCDKLECDIQAKLYDEQGCFEFDRLQNNAEYLSDFTQDALKRGAKTFSNVWHDYDKKYYVDDECFKEVFEYVRDNYISDNIKVEVE